MPTHPTPSQPSHSAPPKPASPPADDDAPQKYKRPLPQPGDKDYVVGQPITNEEADKIEKEEADRYAAAKAAKASAKEP